MRKGFLAAGAHADVESTFHFDHIFGDGEAPADDSINTGALGFDPLAELATDGTVMVDMASLKQSSGATGLQHIGENVTRAGSCW